MSGSFALGAALHFDRDLSADPAPFGAILERLVGLASNRATFTQWTNRVDTKRSRPPQPLDIPKLLRVIEQGETRTAAAETPPKTPDAEHMLVLARTTPSDKAPERFSQTSCRYDFEASFGAGRLQQLGARDVIDALVAFADAVAARAGVLYWADTAVYASCLASCGDSSRLTREQSSHISDLMYWRPRWGQVIRGPAWGTFLGALHVEQLGGIARIERDSSCARVVPLSSGGAFLQATPIEQPIVEGVVDSGELVALARFLEPVMGKRPTAAR